MTHHRKSSWVALVSIAVAGCGETQGPGPIIDDGGIYTDATLTNLPTSALTGLSMDAHAADLDSDGDLDIVIANEFAPNILLINDGTGVFQDASGNLPRTSRDSEDVGLADFDNDGDIDILIVSEDDQVNELYLNDGSANFSDASNRIPVTGTSNAVVVADLTADGLPDVVIGNNGQNEILINLGSAQFANETAARLPATSDITQDIELGDADGDGSLDILVGNEHGNRLLINDGSGVFTDESAARIPFRATPEETREADFGDIDGDGDLDILFANVAAFVTGADLSNRILINTGQGVFEDETADRLGVTSDRSFDGDFIDVDSDGDLDIVTSNADVFGGVLASFKVHLNDGTGVFTDGTSSIFPSTAAGFGFDVEAVDLNGDGQLDLYLASRGSVDRLLLRN